jgi:hypothetical protein
MHLGKPQTFDLIAEKHPQTATVNSVLSSKHTKQLKISQCIEWLPAQVLSAAMAASGPKRAFERRFSRRFQKRDRN